MATPVIKRPAQAMTLEKVDAKLTLLAYDLADAQWVAEREVAFREADRLLDIRLALTRPGGVSGA